MAKLYWPASMALQKEKEKQKQVSQLEREREKEREIGYFTVELHTDDVCFSWEWNYA